MWAASQKKMNNKKKLPVPVWTAIIQGAVELGKYLIDKISFKKKISNNSNNKQNGKSN